MTTIPSVRVAHAPPPTPEAREAATQIEAHFLQTMLKEVRKSAPKDMLGGESVSAWTDLLDQELAGRMAEGGQLGLRDDLLRAMGFDPSAAVEADPIQAPAPRGSLPTDGRVTSGYGWRSDPFHHKKRFHAGIDIGAPEGTPFYAAKAGTVTFAGKAGGYGNLLIVDHGDGVQTRYAHARDLAGWRAGDTVEAGDRLGSVGSTGRSTGPHLHFEVRRDDRPVDPTPWLRQTAPDGVVPDPPATPPGRAVRAYQNAAEAGIPAGHDHEHDSASTPSLLSQPTDGPVR